MGLILLEALLALFIFIAIVWWTMFSGRRKGELPQASASTEQTLNEAASNAPGTAMGKSAAATGSAPVIASKPSTNATPGVTRR